MPKYSRNIGSFAIFSLFMYIYIYLQVVGTMDTTSGAYVPTQTVLEAPTPSKKSKKMWKSPQKLCSADICICICLFACSVGNGQKNFQKNPKKSGKIPKIV